MLQQMRATAPCIAAPGLSTWAAFLLMCLGMFMAILDIQVVATSLPTIQLALGISKDAMSWIQTAYLIAEVIAIPLTGLLTRVLSLRWLVAGGVGLFTVASIGCASSEDFAALLAFRVVQGFSRMASNLLRQSFHESAGTSSAEKHASLLSLES
jgi:MFS transporter, DHA2 family, multidrug resistance protein